MCLGTHTSNYAAWEAQTWRAWRCLCAQVSVFSLVANLDAVGLPVNMSIEIQAEQNEGIFFLTQTHKFIVSARPDGPDQ